MNAEWMVISALALCLASAGAAGQAPLLAGAASVALTPDRPGLFLAGLDENRRALGAHDDIFARCLVLDDGKTRVALCALDLIGLLHDDVRDIARRVTSVPHENIIIACTHTHSAPDTIGLWGPDRTHSGVDERYLEQVKQRTAQCMEQAAAALRPARLYWAVARQPKETSKNFRDEAALDPTIAILQAVGEDGKAIATLVNWACHPEVLWSENKLVSSDYAAYLRAAVEEKQGGLALFFNGALGGMVSPAREVHTFAEAKRLGEAIAEATNAALRSRQRCAGGLELVARELVLPLDNPLLRGAAQAGLLRVSARELNAVRTRMSGLLVGGVPLVTIPGEAVPAIALELRKLWRARGGRPPLFIVGLAHDELGYILLPEQYESDVYQYERSMSLGRRAAERMISAARALVEELARRAGSGAAVNR